MVPKKRGTSSKTRRRRSHHALKGAVLFLCKKCGEAIMPHKMCVRCGYYQERLVVDVVAKLDKKEKKALERQQQETAEIQATEKPLSLEELSK